MEELKLLIKQQNELIKKQNSILAAGLEVLATRIELFGRADCDNVSFNDPKYENLYNKSRDEVETTSQILRKRHYREEVPNVDEG